MNYSRKNQTRKGGFGGFGGARFGEGGFEEMEFSVRGIEKIEYGNSRGQSKKKWNFHV